MPSLKELIRNIPILGDLAVKAAHALRRMRGRDAAFSGSHEYWEGRYAEGGHSGAGSYGKFAEFKAEILNAFVADHAVGSVIEHGCGDGNQLSLAAYPEYLGLDVSSTAIEQCRARFADDPTKSFRLADAYDQEVADLGLSLDVIYHLVEDPVFHAYMNRLFDSSRKYVIVYASDTDAPPTEPVPHVRHRNFTRWVKESRPDWRHVKTIPNRYPYEGDDQTGSFADFFIFERMPAS
jgi:hypothetical protein